LAEVLREVGELSAIEGVPSHQYGERLAKIQKITGDALGHMGYHSPISNEDAWGAEKPTEASRR